ncbi:hypothetical protein MRB53_026850 [Persea americana]|uniref:Uncharacterized protein n=1 Tax=Persea americana TaxID=3435 RepID=A0ACC2LJF8_PERAE|nr:hypothetical protein MRB53_026850 [Persea americana]
MQMQQQPPLLSSNNVAAKESTLHGQKEASMVAAAWTAGFHRRVDKNKTGKEEGNVKEGSSSILVIAEKDIGLLLKEDEDCMHLSMLPSTKCTEAGLGDFRVVCVFHYLVSPAAFLHFVPSSPGISCARRE